MRGAQMGKRFLRRIKSPDAWSEIVNKEGNHFDADVRASILETEFNLQGLSVYEAEDEYWAMRVAASMIISYKNHRDFYGVFLDQDVLERRSKVKCSNKAGEVLDSDVRQRHYDLSDFSLTSIRRLFEYMLEQCRSDLGVFVMSKPTAISFLAKETKGDKAKRLRILSKMKSAQHGDLMLKLWEDETLRFS